MKRIGKGGYKMFEISAAAYWLIILVILIAFEIATMGLTTIWFAGGALVAAIVAAMGVSEPVQIIVFLIVSVGLLFLTRPIAMKYVNQRVEKTNVASLLGQDTIVIERIDGMAGTGQVRINGLEWLAKGVDPNEIIEENTVVTIKKIQGVKAIVSVRTDVVR